MLPFPSRSLHSNSQHFERQSANKKVTSSLLPLYLATISYGTFGNRVLSNSGGGSCKKSRSCTDLRVTGTFLNNNLLGRYPTPGTVILVSISLLLGEELSSHTDYLPSKLFFNSLCSLVLNPLLEVYLPKAVFQSVNPSSLNFPLFFFFGSCINCFLLL